MSSPAGHICPAGGAPGCESLQPSWQYPRELAGTSPVRYYRSPLRLGRCWPALQSSPCRIAPSRGYKEGWQAFRQGVPGGVEGSGYPESLLKPGYAVLEQPARTDRSLAGERLQFCALANHSGRIPGDPPRRPWQSTEPMRHRIPGSKPSCRGTALRWARWEPEAAGDGSASTPQGPDSPGGPGDALQAGVSQPAGVVGLEAGSKLGEVAAEQPLQRVGAPLPLGSRWCRLQPEGRRICHTAHQVDPQRLPHVACVIRRVGNRPLPAS